MKSLFTIAVSVALAVPGLPLLAQLQDNTERQLTCDNSGRDSDTARHCEIREQSYPSIGRLNVDEVQNGAVSVKGALRGDMLVRAHRQMATEARGGPRGMANLAIHVGVIVGQFHPPVFRGDGHTAPGRAVAIKRLGVAGLGVVVG